jgi:hypothetical protein
MTGRKSIVLYSTGYLLQPHQITRELIDRRFGRFTGGFGATRQQVNAMLSGLQGVPLTPYLDTAIDHANLSQVTVYAIDPRGLVSDALSQELRELDLQTDTFSSFYRDALTAAPRQFLDYISARSGGLALGNQNDMASVLRQALADSQGYYLLSYRPGTARKAGKAHRIDVKVKRPGVSTLYRKSYRELDPAIVLRGDVLASFQYPDLFQGYPLQLEISFQDGQMYVKTMVPSEAVRFVREAGGFRGRVEVYGALFDSSGAWLGQELLFSKTQDLVFSRERKEELQGYDNVSLTAVADPPPAGEYRLGVVVRQGADGSMSTIQQPLLLEK